MARKARRAEAERAAARKADREARKADREVLKNGHFTLVVEDLDTGEVRRQGPQTARYDTASIVKVNILAALLLQSQSRGEPVPPVHKRLAAAMIQRSDNNATDRLWKAIGGKQGLDAANRTLGLKDTAGDPAGHWGLTRTTAPDQLRLLKAVFDDKSGTPLRSASRAYLESLMGRIQADQDWGVPAASDKDATPVVKNGWLQRTTNRRWDINSIGRIDAGGHHLLAAVLSDRHPTQAAGIRLTESAARTAARELVRDVREDQA